jgi:hypothetical protein
MLHPLIKSVVIHLYLTTAQFATYVVVTRDLSVKLREKPCPRNVKADTKPYLLDLLLHATFSKVVAAWGPCYYVNMIVSFGTGGTEDIFNGKNRK